MGVYSQPSRGGLKLHISSLTGVVVEVGVKCHSHQMASHTSEGDLTVTFDHGVKVTTLKSGVKVMIFDLDL